MLDEYEVPKEKKRLSITKKYIFKIIIKYYIINYIITTSSLTVLYEPSICSLAACEKKPATIHFLNLSISPSQLMIGILKRWKYLTN